MLALPRSALATFTICVQVAPVIDSAVTSCCESQTLLLAEEGAPPAGAGVGGAGGVTGSLGGTVVGGVTGFGGTGAGGVTGFGGTGAGAAGVGVPAVGCL